MLNNACQLIDSAKVWRIYQSTKQIKCIFIVLTYIKDLNRIL